MKRSSAVLPRPVTRLAAFNGDCVVLELRKYLGNSKGIVWNCPSFIEARGEKIFQN